MLASEARVGDILLAPPDVMPSASPPPASAFIRRQGHQFVDQNGAPFYFIGFNAPWLLNRAGYDHEWGRTEVLNFLRDSHRLGLRVVRLWAFNKGVPRVPPNEYDEEQLEGLDFVIYAASRVGMRLVLALTNFWHQFKGPEEYMYYAGGAEGRTILDYYRSSEARSMVKKHMATITRRVNTFTGLAYKDDPTIMAWDVMNEPRCPGCLAESEARDHMAFLASCAGYLRTLAPKQLVGEGSEGYFPLDTPEALHLLNPGAGATCEGDDWLTVSAQPEHDFASIHVYDRQIERIPVNYDPTRNDPVWKNCDMVCYLNWFTRWTALHAAIAGDANGRIGGKPLIMEEFGLTWWNHWEHDRRVLFQVAFEMLADSRACGGALSGLMFWAGAADSTGDTDGYNVYLQRTPNKPITAPAPFAYELSTPAPGGACARLSRAAAAAYSTAKEAHDTGGRGYSGSPAPDKRKLLANMSASAVDGDDNVDDGDDDVMSSRRSSRRLQEQVQSLDGFRRAWARNDCAVRASKTWRPLPFARDHVDYEAYRAFTDSHDMVDIIKAAAKRINNS